MTSLAPAVRTFGCLRERSLRVQFLRSDIRTRSKQELISVLTTHVIKAVSLYLQHGLKILQITSSRTSTGCAAQHTPHRSDHTVTQFILWVDERRTVVVSTNTTDSGQGSVLLLHFFCFCQLHEHSGQCWLQQTSASGISLSTWASTPAPRSRQRRPHGRQVVLNHLNKWLTLLFLQARAVFLCGSLLLKLNRLSRVAIVQHFSFEMRRKGPRTRPQDFCLFCFGDAAAGETAVLYRESLFPNICYWYFQSFMCTACNSTTRIKEIKVELFMAQLSFLLTSPIHTEALFFPTLISWGPHTNRCWQTA